MDIVVYTKPNCKYCVELKEFMAFAKIPYKEIEIVPKITIEMVREAKKSYILIEKVKRLAPEAKTVPVVFVDGVWIGGWSELKKKLNDDGIGL